MTNPETPKVKKSDKALAIFSRHLPNRPNMDRHAFRDAVIADFKKEIGLRNAGTLGMYFSWADKQVTGRPCKQYIRTSSRSSAPKEAVGSDGFTDSQRIANAQKEVQKAAAAARVPRSTAVTPLAAKKAIS